MDGVVRVSLPLTGDRPAPHSDTAVVASDARISARVLRREVQKCAELDRQ